MTTERRGGVDGRLPGPRPEPTELAKVWQSLGRCSVRPDGTPATADYLFRFVVPWCGSAADARLVVALWELLHAAEELLQADDGPHTPLQFARVAALAVAVGGCKGETG